MNESKSNVLSDNYINVIKSKLDQLSDDLLIEDINILCEYVILRFLKTSPDVVAVTKEDVIKKLEEFVSQIWPFLLAFVTLVNSQPIKSQVSELFGNVIEDTEA